MDSGYYGALTGLVARTQALDTAAANLANAQTPGYRAEREYFRSFLLDPSAQESQLGEAVNRFGLLGGNRLSSTQGPLQQTGSPLDLAIEGSGFFAIQTANGMRFTRDGSFHRSQSGLLVTAANEPVLSGTKQSIAIPPGDVAVGADGTLSVNGAAVAGVGVFEFSPETQLKAEGANRYIAPEGATILDEIICQHGYMLDVLFQGATFDHTNNLMGGGFKFDDTAGLSSVTSDAPIVRELTGRQNDARKARNDPAQHVLSLIEAELKPKTATILSDRPRFLHARLALVVDDGEERRCMEDRLDRTALHFDSKPAVENEKELVFVVVAVPRETAVDLGDLDVRIVDFGDDARRPQLGERCRDLLRGGNAGHDHS